MLWRPSVCGCVASHDAGGEEIWTDIHGKWSIERFRPASEIAMIFSTFPSVSSVNDGFQ